MSDSNASAPSPITLAQSHLSNSLKVSPIYNFVMSGVEITESTVAGKSIAELVLEDRHVNSKGSLHGSVSATMVDWSSGSALSTLSSPSGVSTDMHVTFLSRAMVGETVTIEGTIDKLGKRLAFTRVEIRNKSKGGEVVVVAVHTKFVGGV